MTLLALKWQDPSMTFSCFGRSDEDLIIKTPTTASTIDLWTRRQRRIHQNKSDPEKLTCKLSSQRKMAQFSLLRFLCICAAIFLVHVGAQKKEKREYPKMSTGETGPEYIRRKINSHDVRSIYCGLIANSRLKLN